MRSLLVGAVGLALLACSAVADSVAAPGSSCTHGGVPATIAAKHVCLKTGSSCSARFERQYARYGYSCIVGVLVRPKPPTPTVTTTTTTTAPPASKAGAFAGTWYAVDPSDLSLEQVTFGDDGSLSFQDNFATVCGGAAGSATSTGSVTGNTWTASAPTTLSCPDNGGSVPNVLFRFTLNANGTLTFTGMPEVWTRTRPP